MTASNAWPTSIFKMEERSTNRWQHRLKREHPTGTERTKIAHQRVRMEGWRQWQLGGRKNRVQRKNKRTHLTPTGLLMEGVSAQNPVNESPTTVMF